ncbi:WD40 repeat domain-containing protein, partial [Candidatus Dependentiae bacterium]
QHDHEVNSAVFSPDGKYVSTASGNTVKILDTNTGILIKTFQHDHEVNSAVFSPDGKYVLIASDDTSRLWNTNTGILMETFLQHDAYSFFRPSSTEFSPDGKYVLFTRPKKKAILYDIKTGISKQSFNCSIVMSTEFSPDSKSILTKSGFTVELWDTNTGKLKQTFNYNHPVNSAEFSPDGKYVSTASWETAIIWQINNKKSFNKLYSLEEICFLLLLSKEKSNLFRSKYCTNNFKKQAIKILENIDTSPFFNKEENEQFKKEGFIRKSICKKYNIEITKQDRYYCEIM